RLRGELVPRDDHALHLARALADLHELHVTKDALDGMIAQVSVAAEDLYRVQGDRRRGLRREELRLRGCDAELLAAVGEPRCPMGQQARGLQLHSHIRQLLLNRPMARERLAELLARAGVSDGILEGGPRQSPGEARDP